MEPLRRSLAKVFEVLQFIVHHASVHCLSVVLGYCRARFYWIVAGRGQSASRCMAREVRDGKAELWRLASGLAVKLDPERSGVRFSACPTGSAHVGGKGSGDQRVR